MTSSEAIKSQTIKYNYPLRATACLVVLAVHLSLFWQDASVSWLQWAIVIAHTLVYPHLAYLISSNRDQEIRNVLTDSFLYSFSLGLWGFNPFLMAIFISSCNMTNLAAGGKAIFIKGVVYQLLGLLLGGLFGGFYFRADLDVTAMTIGAIGLVFYTTSLGVRIYSINSSLLKNKARLSNRQTELEHINELALMVNSHLNLDTIMESVMKTFEKVYPFESLYVISFNANRDTLKIIGAYGHAVSEYEENAFKQLEMDPLQDHDSIFVNGLIQNRIINIPNLTRESVEKGANLDKVLYNIKPSRSIAYFPVHVSGQVVAGVAFINYTKTFSLKSADLKRISEYLVLVGTAIKNVNMFEQAERAKKHAEQSEQAKSDFLANMSHEIRTPMTAILGYSEALLSPDLSAEQQQNFLHTIMRSGKHLITIINDILDISKIESNNIVIEEIDVPLVNVLSDVVDYAQINSKEKLLEFSLQVQYPIPSIIQSDITRLKQILLNLCNNAIKFTQTGWVRLEVSYNVGQLVFSMVDSGVGLSEDEAEKLFKAFSQADTSTTRLYGGTGLGLYISKRFAMLMDGDLTLESEKGKGSRFTLTLSTQLPDNTQFIMDNKQLTEKMDAYRLMSQQNVIPEFTGHVLVAEDNPENQILVERLLTQTGAQVTLVENGQLAVEQVRIQAFDLILLDMQMPIMGGKEAAELIKGIAPHTPLVAFTANVMRHQIDDYLLSGFHAVVEKPIEQTHFYDVLRRFLLASQSEKHILVVEDNIINQKVLQRYLLKINPNLTITCAENGLLALEEVKTQPFDLIFMDMEMPKMGGLEATQKIRALGCETPIYMVSGHDPHDYLKISEDHGATGYLVKPINRVDIQTVFNNHF